MEIISIRNLSKKFGRNYVVKNLNIEIKKGRVFALIGPNGAGKTTTLSMISGILTPDSGEIYVFGKNLFDDPLSIKSKIGVVPEQPYVYGNMSVHDYLSFFADLYKVKDKENRIDSLLSYLNLNISDFKNKKLKAFSKGMKQRVSIARALLHDPEILIMDEPASGLDPAGIKEIRDIIYKQKQEGKTIIISSHILSEVEKVSDDIAIIDKGEILKIGSVEDILNLNYAASEVELEIEVDNINDCVVKELKGFSFVKDVNVFENILKIKTFHENKKEISKCITKNGCVILKMCESKKNLEDVFVKITQNNSK